MLRLSLVALILSIFLSTGTDVYAVERNELPTNAVGVNVLGLVGGGISGNYEYLFNERDALFIEAGADGNNGYSYQIAYLRHSLDHESKKGLLAPAWGPFISFTKFTGDFEDKDLDKEYEMKVKSLNIGLMMTHSYELGKNLRLNWRLGYGLPVISDYSWDDDTFEDRKLMENITKVIVGIEGGITLTYVF